jgi:hypothetical protein
LPKFEVTFTVTTDYSIEVVAKDYKSAIRIVEEDIDPKDANLLVSTLDVNDAEELDDEDD